MYERRNQRWNPLKQSTGSNLADMGRTAVGARVDTDNGDSRRLRATVAMVMGKACGVPHGENCRGKAGHRTRQPATR